MNIRIKNFIFLAIFFTFTFFITKYYISEKNQISVNKSRALYTTLSEDQKDHLPILENDTNNIIIYVDDLENYKKKRKKRFWEKLISNNNE